MNRARVEQVGLWLIAAIMLPAGLQAAIMPRSFFDDFPIGRGWISSTGDVYNEHLVRDVGALFLALVLVTAWTAWRRRAARAIAVAWLLQGVLHLVFHVGHLDGYGTADKIALIGSLISVPALAFIVLWAGSASPRSHAR